MRLSRLSAFRPFRLFAFSLKAKGRLLFA